MYPRLQLAILLTIAGAASGLTSASASSDTDLVVWQPPSLQLPAARPSATVPKEMITTLRVAKARVFLEESYLREMQKLLGGAIGRRGDAGESLAWLCFAGGDASGRWALWLESSELGGDTGDGFAYARLDGNLRVDHRCGKLPGTNGGIVLPDGLGLDQSEAQVCKILGNPTIKYRDTVAFDHEREGTLNGQAFTADNDVDVVLRGGRVRIIQIWKQTSFHVIVRTIAQRRPRLAERPVRRQRVRSQG